MAATTLFNACVTSSAISAAVQTGMLVAVHDHRTVDVDAFAARARLSAGSIHAIADVLVQEGILEIVEHQPQVVARGPGFEDIWRNKGYFLWLVGGYGDMLRRVGELSTPEQHAAVGSVRDGRVIAQAGREYGSRFVDPIVNDIVGAIDFAVLADLGCGSANRIIQLAHLHPEKRFIGVEVDAGAVDVARAAVASHCLKDRVRIVHDDVRRLQQRPEYADVDALLSFFLAHELWPREDCMATLEDVRRRMPRVRNFLLSDTYRSPRPASGEPPIFTLGFELTHAVMGQRLPTAQEWVALFEESAWDLCERVELEIPYSEVFHLVPSGAWSG